MHKTKNPINDKSKKQNSKKTTLKYLLSQKTIFFSLKILHNYNGNLIIYTQSYEKQKIY